jgi:hypothetical protein
MEMEMRRDEAAALLVTRPVMLPSLPSTDAADGNRIEPSAQLASLMSNVKQKHKMSFYSSMQQFSYDVKGPSMHHDKRMAMHYRQIRISMNNRQDGQREMKQNTTTGQPHSRALMEERKIIPYR